MPNISSCARRELIKKLRKLGFSADLLAEGITTI